jgi:hypothetical protein
MGASIEANELDLWHKTPTLKSRDVSVGAITNEAFDAERT